VARAPRRPLAVNSDDSLDIRATLVTWLELILAGTPLGLMAPTEDLEMTARLTR